MIFLIFVTICICIIYPGLTVIILSPFIIMLGAILIYAIKNKITTGYWCPWEHREELKKKGKKYNF